MTRSERISPAFSTLFTGMLALTVLVIFWTGRANSTESMLGGYRGLAQSRPTLPGIAGSVQTVCSLTAPQLSVKASQAPASTPRLAPAALPAAVTKAMPPVSHSPAVLDKRRLFALGAIETGNNDYEIGRAGEVSRYQIMPSVWKHYSQSSYYDNPQVSREVAQQHWSSLYASFKRQTGREPDNFDMYVLWNTCYGYYASKSFKPAHLDPVVRDRAQRFVNLVQRGES